jgi:hypothetical protein
LSASGLKLLYSVVADSSGIRFCACSDSEIPLVMSNPIWASSCERGPMKLGRPSENSNTASSR